MENDLKGIENYFELTAFRVVEGSSYRESTVFKWNCIIYLINDYS